MQFLVQPDGSPDGQGFKPQITDTPKVFAIVTTSTPAPLPLPYNTIELTLPLCGFRSNSRKRTRR